MRDLHALKLLSVALLMLALPPPENAAQPPANPDSLKAVISRPATASDEKVKALLQLASHHLFQQPQLTIELSQQALEIAKQLGDVKMEALVHNSLGTGYWSKGFLYDAFIEFERSKSLAESIGDKQLIAQNRGFIGNVYNDLGNYSLAISYYRQALPLFIEMKNAARESAMYNNIGRAFVKMNQIDSAAIYLEKAAAASANAGIAPSPVSVYNLAEVHYLKNNTPKALTYLKNAFMLAERDNEERAAAIAYTLWARIKKDQGDLDSALLLSSKSVEIASATGIKDVIYQAYHTHSEILAAKNRFEAAYYYDELYQDFRDSLQSIEILRRLDFYEFEKKEKELEELKAQSEADEYRSWLQRLVIIGMSIIVLLLVVLISTTYRSRQKLAKANQLLTLKNQEVIEKSAELTQLNNLKDKLFSIIAHDLRVPLTTLSATLEMAKTNILNKQELEQLLTILSGEVEQSSSLLDNLLIWSRSQLGGVKLNQVKVALPSVVDDVVALLAPVAGEKNIIIKTNVADGLSLYADIDNVKLILRNLLSNAIKYTKPGGDIMISAHSNGHEATIGVTDSGVGMDESTLQRLFTLNVSSSPGTMNEKGSGLGLVLVKEFVSLNNGRIAVQSQKGRGTTFEVVLPLAR